MVEILGHDLRCLANRSDTQIQPSDALQPLSHKSGKIIWVKVRNEALLDNYVIWIFEDASEQKGLKMLNHRLEQSVSNEVEKRTRHTRKTNAEYRKEIEQLQYYDVSLTQSREKYRVLFQNSQNGIIFADDNGGISQINDAMRLLMNARNLVEFNHTSVMQICHEMGADIKHRADCGLLCAVSCVVPALPDAKDRTIGTARLYHGIFLSRGMGSAVRYLAHDPDVQRCF